ncbi:MAG: fatty acid desaturase [Cytophagaceae bacterium]|nr:fatty acid desaturase [Gemmatimonadaceae bacterium]
MTATAHPDIAVEGMELVPDTEPEWKRLGSYGGSNIAVTLLEAGAWFGLLTLLDNATLPLWVRGIVLLVFCLTMQGVFTMAHEYCHRNAHSDPRLGYAIGWVTSTIFGTAPTFLRVQHWGHHRRNRTEAERAEFIREGESALFKHVQYYFAVLGGIWLASLAFPVVSILLPYRSARWFAHNARFNSFAAAFLEFDQREWLRMRIEGAVFLVLWVAIIGFGPWQWETLAVAYGAFAFSWSSLQWVYHLHTPLHVIEGAYNLRAPWLVRVLFLNFNYNLTHHRHPWMPWQELYRHSDQQETQPLWYRYARVVLPPVPFPEDPAVLEKRYF